MNRNPTLVHVVDHFKEYMRRELHSSSISSLSRGSMSSRPGFDRIGWIQ
ncbi:hypothetical protein CsSME_00011730 [Camellia sinensis var. sinensis]